MRGEFPESVRAALVRFRPADRDLRAIPACVPFTADEWEVLRRGCADHEKWTIEPEGASLSFYRVVEEVRFFWRARFETRGALQVLSWVDTLRGPRAGKVFETDTAQIASVWYFLDIVLLERRGGDLFEDYEGPVLDLLGAKDAPPESLEALKRRLQARIEGSV